MTYLELVNNLMLRLRERPVSTINETTYSSLVGTFINDAKDEVENAWQWSAIRTTLATTTTANVYGYELNGVQNRFTMLDVINATSDNHLIFNIVATSINNHCIGIQRV